ncbi:MAG: hypothetical protein JOY96_05155 [Verrucomicrobia bacterium]|nr:hypothetical protein [Verrucomicrobiota bacterium]
MSIFILVGLLAGAFVPKLKAGEPILSFQLQNADGAQVVYQFQVPGALPAEPFEQSADAQHRAGVAALAWAKSFYKAHDIFLTSVAFKAAPIPHYLATFDGAIGQTRQPFFAVVLAGSALLEPVEIAAGASGR